MITKRLNRHKPWSTVSGLRMMTLLPMVLAVLTLCTVGALGQTTTSNIEGTVSDPNGAVLVGATVKVKSEQLATERSTVTDSSGSYRFTALPAGRYTVTVSQSGFGDSITAIELTLNKTASLNIQMQVSGNVGQVDITADVPMIDPTSTSTGSTINPRQITELPVNGRNYLDLLQLVPGVAINRRADPGSDNATPSLGERGGNNNFLIDGHPNKDTVNGGPAAQFNQETIAEFQVLTNGYKAEFGQASGAIVNVITKSGSNAYRGSTSFFLRNDALDSSNSLTEGKEAPDLDRYDLSASFGGPIIKDRFFFFGSAERITEDRRIDFTYPNTGNTVVNNLLRSQEDPFDTPALNRETRAFLKLNQNLGRHQLSQEVNYTNLRVKNYLPLSLSQSLPSSRRNDGARRLLIAVSDTVLIGDQGDPYILTVRGSYRGEPSSNEAAHPEIAGSTRLNLYSTTCTTCVFFPGDLPQLQFGVDRSPSYLDQKYTAFSANLAKRYANHDVKIGWNFLRTKVDGLEAKLIQNQLFTSPEDYTTFGPQYAGVALYLVRAGITPAKDEIHLRNDYNGAYIQDDFKLAKNLTLNLGLRWDYDSEFAVKSNFSPRVGAAWAIDDKTVVRASWGRFYDNFRLGMARNIPLFGGSDQKAVQTLVFPRLLYGSPSFVSSIALLSGLPGGCFSNRFVGNLTDAQITAGGVTCPLAPSLPLIGVDRLNNVVAVGRSAIPANTVVTVANVQGLTGLTPQQFADQASAAIGMPAGYFSFNIVGLLNNALIPPQDTPWAIAPGFGTPHTDSISIGIQREIVRDTVLEVDYFRRDIKNILGVRSANIDFAARVLGRRYLAPFPAGPIETFGPFFKGRYDGVVVNLNTRFMKRFVIGGNYGWADAVDNALPIGTRASDSFIGAVPVVTETSTGRSNANGGFVTTAGRYVAPAGSFLNGPDADKGPSDLALKHTFQLNGLIDLPWQMQISGIFRAQSGYRFTRTSTTLVDPDGDSSVNGVDVIDGRNKYTAPAYVNMDFRFSKKFTLNERVNIQALFEFFNVFNRQNPAGVQTQQNVQNSPFGKATQVLPGREGQVGIRVEF